MKKTILYSVFLVATLTCFCQETHYKKKFENPILVLNLGTFHMGDTPDAYKTEFDEHDQKNIKNVHEIAQMIAMFKPTVIIVETTTRYQKKLEQYYQEYLKNPTMNFINNNEIGLLAYEVGRLSGTKRIYGIDYKENYNYAIYYNLKNKVDSITYLKYKEIMINNERTHLQKLGRKPTVLEMLITTNQPDYLDYLININADILTYVSTKGNHEGADEAAKFYHRNLVMYSNLNQIKLTKDDRVFILMGAAHTAYFNEFIKRSPKYKLVDVFDFLK